MTDQLLHSIMTFCYWMAAANAGFSVGMLLIVIVILGRAK